MTTIANMPLTKRSIRIVIVSSMEQIIGAGISTVVGVMLPMIQLVMHPGLSSVMQGVIGAMGLVGIAIGSLVIGKLSDIQGYLTWFRICPILIICGALICWLFPTPAMLIVGLFIAGSGVGGGYSLDSAYISELLPDKWRGRMIGIAKASCALGFIVVAFVCWLILKSDPNPHLWNKIVLIIGVGGLVTLLMRIRWAGSPQWLCQHGRIDEARKALDLFYGPNVQLPTTAQTAVTSQTATQNSAAASSTAKTTDSGWLSMFRGKNLLRVIYAGVPWACEGLGVYGFGVFLPVLVMALGIESDTAVGMHKVIDSVGVTTLVNFFILPGFVIGLLILNKVNHTNLMAWGFIGSAVGLGILLCGYSFHWANWLLVLGFVIFEVLLNAGPHLITYIIPAAIYPVADRGTGSGIAAMNGKIGAIVGVVIMPILLDSGGPRLVLIVSIAVMLLGALISWIFGKLLLTKN